MIQLVWKFTKMMCAQVIAPSFVEEPVCIVKRTAYTTIIIILCFMFFDYEMYAGLQMDSIPSNSAVIFEGIVLNYEASENMAEHYNNNKNLL